MERGYIIAFKGNGGVFRILSSLLCIFDKEWRGLKWKPWHTAIAWEKAYDGWYILEARANGVEINYYTDKYLKENTRSHKWFTEPPTKKKMGEFLKAHNNMKYDVAIYAHTMLQYLLLRVIEWGQKRFFPKHHFTISLPRVLNDRWSCWEIAFWFCRAMGKPVQESVGLPATRYPMISDFLRATKRLDKIKALKGGENV